MRRCERSKVHVAVDTLGHSLELHASPADKQDRTQGRRTAKAVLRTTRRLVDQGYAGEQVEDDTGNHGIKLQVVRLPQAKRRFVPIPRRWVVERSFA